MQLMNIFPLAQEIRVYRQGECRSYVCGEKFEEIVAEWNAMTASALPMPAYGVSIDSETVRALAGGVWVEFRYSAPMTCEDMPFERLLIEVQPQFMGFNVIRYNSDGGYAGRCYYIDLNGRNMGKFYECLA